MKNNNNYLEYKGYIGDIKYSANDKCFYGRVIGLPKEVGITYEGESAKELYQDFKDGVNDYLDFCTENNIKPHKSNGALINIQLPIKVSRNLDKQAESSGKTVSAIVGELIASQYQYTR